MVFEIDPNHVPTLYIKGNYSIYSANTLFKLGRFDEALVIIEKVLKLDPNHAETLLCKCTLIS